MKSQQHPRDTQTSIIEKIELLLSRVHLFEWLTKNLQHGLQLAQTYLPVLPGVVSLTGLQPLASSVIATFALGFIMGVLVTRLEIRRMRPTTVAPITPKRPKPRHPRPTSTARAVPSKRKLASARVRPSRQARRRRKKKEA